MFENDAIKHSSFVEGQTRSLKGNSFLIGVAYCATSGWINWTGNQGAPRDCDQRLSPLLCTAYASANWQYTPITLLFLWGKRTFSFSGGTPNGYRDYNEQDAERARFVAGIRSLDLSLDEIMELLAMRDRREAPCRTLLNLIEQKANQIEERIRLLKQMEVDLRQLHRLGLAFPTDDVDGKYCICHLVSEHSNVSTTS